jgi:hypothetical protein
MPDRFGVPKVSHTAGNQARVSNLAAGRFRGNSSKSKVLVDLDSLKFASNAS